MAVLRHRPEEVLGMFSEALRILDENTVKYMIEELQKELEEKTSVIGERDAALKEQEAEIAELKQRLRNYENVDQA